MAHLSPLDQAAVRLCIATGSLLAITAFMYLIEIEGNGSGWHFAFALGMLAPAAIFLYLVLVQAWQALKLVCRWLDDMVIEYQIRKYPLVRA